MGTAGDQASIPDFFDPVTFKPVSLQEKLSANNVGSKQVVSLDKAYAKAVEEARSVDPIIESKRKSIDRQIADLDDRARAINLNYAECHEGCTHTHTHTHTQTHKHTHTTHPRT